MEYIFSNDGAKKILRTKDNGRDELSGFHQFVSEYPNETVTDNFHVVRKIFSKDDAEGNHYTWYEVDQYYRTIDRSGALAEKMSATNATLGDAICELDMIYESRLARLEDAILNIDKDLDGGD